MTTAKEILAAWDSGQLIHTVTMGGLGPGYEQVIQIAAVEFLRAAVKSEKTPTTLDKDEYANLCKEVLVRIDKGLDGMSGAQYGAATWLAWQWFAHDSAEAVQSLVADDKRQIMASKFFPKAP